MQFSMKVKTCKEIHVTLNRTPFHYFHFPNAAKFIGQNNSKVKNSFLLLIYKCSLLQVLCLYREDKQFDPFAETPVDGVIAAQCSVQVGVQHCSAVLSSGRSPALLRSAQFR